MNRIKKIVEIIETDKTKSLLYYFEYNMRKIDIPSLEQDVRDMQIDTVINDNDHSEEVKEKREDISEAEEYLSDFSGRVGAPLPGTLGAAMDRSNVNIGGLQMKSKSVSLDDKYVDEMVVFNDLKSRMFNHGITNVNSLNSQDSFTLDLNDDYRKNITKIIRSTSLIATQGRIGPGNFIFMNQRMIMHFSPFLTRKDNGDMMFSTMDIIIDPTITDKTVVGRINEKEQPGLKFITNGVNYSIEELSDRCCYQYATLDIIYETIE
jgi:hypothetical protein